MRTTDFSVKGVSDNPFCPLFKTLIFHTEYNTLISFNVRSENLVVDQDNINLLVLFFILNTRLSDNAPMLQW